jgi:predicted nucleotidyltransferase
VRPSEALERHRAAILEIAARHRVHHVRVFGSVLRGEDRDGSDLDLLVEPGAHTTLFDLAAIQVEAEELLGVPVDVLTPNSLPRRSRERVLGEARPL